MRIRLFLLYALVSQFWAHAQEISVNGYVDLRLAAPGATRSWLDGGEGKLRYAGNGVSVQAGGALAEMSAQITPELRLVTDLRYDPREVDKLGMTETYLRYRPVSTSGFRWWVKAGVFFAPISEENDSLGWTSPWTITSSAINSWVGEELRTIGIEPTLEWRDIGFGTLRLFAAAFADNETAGTVLGTSGWNLTDSITPIGGHVPVPSYGGVSAPPSLVFDQTDSRTGWYAGGSLDVPGWGRVTILRYDNEASLFANLLDTGWHTRFWSLGLRGGTEEDGPVILAQAMIGDTAVADSADFAAGTRFSAEYLLAGWQFGDWRLAGRVDHFVTAGYDNFQQESLAERGTAETLALTWRPKRWLRLTAEGMRVDSYRAQRDALGLAPRQVEMSGQVMARFFF